MFESLRISADWVATVLNRYRRHARAGEDVPCKSGITRAALLLLFLCASCGEPANNQSAVDYINPDAATGISQATRVGDVPLAFTSQMFPFDAEGKIVGHDDLPAQVDQVLKNTGAALLSAGADMTGLVRVHAYLRDDTMTDVVLGRLREALPDGVFPAVTFMSGGEPRPGVMFSMDVVAVATPPSVSPRVGLFRSEKVYAPSGWSHVGVAARGRRLFISGQAERGDSLVDACEKTMRNLLATLAYAGGHAADVVYIKAFINPIDDAWRAEEAIASFFRNGRVPPIVSVEWLENPGRAEIELIAAPPPGNTETIIEHYAPNWMSQATTFSRMVDVNYGGLLFTSGLYGEAHENEEGRAHTIFETLGSILKKAGSDYDHLVKATYYPSTEEGRKGLVKVRSEFYNPARPPAASLIKVRGTGRRDLGLTLDMIGVIPE